MHAPKPLLSTFSLTLLAACVGSAFGAAGSAAAATTWTVNDCGDAVAGSGTSGSLRYAAANAVSGDTVNIVCSAISLTTGAVTLPQQDITIDGPAPANALIQAVSPPANGNIFEHTGGGNLRLNYIAAEYGTRSNSAGDALGGCVYSNGNAYLDHVTLYRCTAHATAASAYATGGGVYAKGALTLTNSVVSHNTAQSDAFESVGGGAFAGNNVTLSKSTIQSNAASGAQGYGGGVYFTGPFTTVSISDSTIAGNSATFNAGGVSIYSPTVGTTATVSIVNSTITNNSAGDREGGIYAIAGTVKLISSTITNNSATRETDPRFPNAGYHSPGVALLAQKANMLVYLQSTLIANNTYGSTEDDFSTSIRHATAFTVTFDPGSSNNLVRGSVRTTLPAGTITNVCPLLGPLRDNGGSTPTIALLSGSRGINEGSNPAGLTYDQRGAPYARVSDTGPDIGAYEYQRNDIVFDSSFEGCP